MGVRWRRKVEDRPSRDGKAAPGVSRRSTLALFRSHRPGTGGDDVRSGDGEFEPRPRRADTLSRRLFARRPRFISKDGAFEGGFFVHEPDVDAELARIGKREAIDNPWA